MAPSTQPLDERVIHVADELEDLHRMLVVERGWSDSADHREPLGLFCDHHGDGTAGGGVHSLAAVHG